MHDLHNGVQVTHCIFDELSQKDKLCVETIVLKAIQQNDGKFPFVCMCVWTISIVLTSS